MYRERLLERIRAMELNPLERGEQNVTGEIHSITEHLMRMLNTRQGSTPIQDDYGIPDFTNVPGETITETAHEMERVIKSVIQRYEPRLANVKVSFNPVKDEILALRFKIEAVLQSDNQVPVAFETVVNSEGRVEVTG